MSDMSDDFSRQILKIMEDYKGAVLDDVQKTVDSLTIETVQKLHGANPAGAGKYGSWDAYNAGWTSQRKKTSKNVYKKVIHNATHYRLAHLLEHGHALLNGGRAQAFPHIEPIEKELESKFIIELQSNIEGGQ